MQLQDLIKPLDEMSDEELRDRLREIRHNRTKAKPATANRTKRAAKVGGQGRLNEVTDMFANLSDEDRQALIKQLGG